MKDFYIEQAPAREADPLVVSFFLAGAKELCPRKDGAGNYLRIKLLDRTGEIEGRVWEEADSVAANFATGEVIKVRGRLEKYKNKFQLNIEKLRRAAETEYDIADFFRTTKYDVEQLWSRLRGAIGVMQNPFLRALGDAFLDDVEVAGRLKQAPAAKSLHHAWRGGLLEHVVTLIDSCESATQRFPWIDRDLLITGALLHDIGKVRELEWTAAPAYTLEGHLVGHISIGLAMAQEKMAAIPTFSRRLQMLVEHMILSHHGKHEFGSPKLPMIAEALLLNMLDDMEAKMQMVRDALDVNIAGGRKGDEFTDRIWALERSMLDTSRFLALDGGNPPPQELNTDAELRRLEEQMSALPAED
jgi:3'-5' exoribonuclease